MEREESEQERFWRTDFGTKYGGRNADLAKARHPFFCRILQLTGPLASVCELGANIGENLKCLNGLDPDVALFATEINPSAFDQLLALGYVGAENRSIQDFEPEQEFEMVFTCGVLIHLAPADLGQVYEKMYRLSQKYILINEYFNPEPIEVAYRGHQNKLFKRDFAGELLDLYPNRLEVVEYGFLWRRLEPGWDDTNWTLLKKKDLVL